MVTIIILTILLVVVSIIFAIIEGSIMILLKFGWLIICVSVELIMRVLINKGVIIQPLSFSRNTQRLLWTNGSIEIIF